jgi:hypothetical protein
MPGGCGQMQQQLIPSEDFTFFDRSCNRILKNGEWERGGEILSASSLGCKFV